MKKRFTIATTVLAVFLTICILGASVYAALNSQTIGVSNTITFSGSSQNMSFIVKGLVRGSTKENGNEPNVTWEYDYENSSTNSFVWEIGALEFKTVGLTLDQIHITYEFTIENDGNCEILANFSGTDKQLTSGLVGTSYYRQTRLAERQTGTQVNIPLNGVAVLEYELTITDLEGSYSDDIEFDIILQPLGE